MIATEKKTDSRVLRGLTVGVVTSAKRDKSRTVAVQYQYKHPKYGKYLSRQASYQVHDETNESREGDKVEIVACRPMSKTKTFRLVRVLEKAPEPITHVTEAAV